MTHTPTGKHIAYKGRRYRMVGNVLQQWRTVDDSYHLAWRPFVGSPELERIIRELMERNNG